MQRTAREGSEEVGEEDAGSSRRHRSSMDMDR
jgi:hypothetical protein